MECALQRTDPSPRLNDAAFVSKIFDIELPRATKLNEMAPKSVYFFRGPRYDDAEVAAFFAKLKATTYGTYTFTRSLYGLPSLSGLSGLPGSGSS